MANNHKPATLLLVVGISTLVLGSSNLEAQHQAVSDAPQGFDWPRPSLVAQRTQAGLTVSWPITATPFVLESSSLADAGAWRVVAQAPVQTNRCWQVTIAASDVCRWFRLRDPRAHENR